MGLQGVGSPEAMHSPVGHARLPGEIPGRPLGEAGGGRLQGQRDNLCPLPRGDRRRAARPRPVPQAPHAELGEAATQPADLHHGVAGTGCDLHSRDALGHQQDRPSPPTEPGAHRRRPLQALQLTPIGLADDDGANVIGHGFPPGECQGIY